MSVPVRGAVVDVHSHLYPRWYLDRLAERSAIPRVRMVDGKEHFQLFAGEPANGGRPLDSTFWSMEDKLRALDADATDQAVVSLGNPWLNPFSASEGIQLAERANEELAALEGRTGGRLCGLGVLPNADLEQSIEVARRVAGRHGLHGIASGYSVAGYRIHDRRLDPFWAVLTETGLPLCLHPNDSPLGFDAEFGHVLPIAFGFAFETTVAVASFLLSGVLDRFPDLRVVVAHGGGALPFLAGRLDATAGRGTAIRDALGRLYFDTVVYSSAPIVTLLEFVEPDHLMYGTDHPFRLGRPAENRDAIAATVAGPARQEVLGASAVRLFDLPNLVEVI